jgi:hypothetical protein
MSRNTSPMRPGTPLPGAGTFLLGRRASDRGRRTGGGTPLGTPLGTPRCSSENPRGMGTSLIGTPRTPLFSKRYWRERKLPLRHQVFWGVQGVPAPNNLPPAGGSPR